MTRYTDSKGRPVQVLKVLNGVALTAANELVHLSDLVEVPRPATAIEALEQKIERLQPEVEAAGFNGEMNPGIYRYVNGLEYAIRVLREWEAGE